MIRGTFLLATVSGVLLAGNLPADTAAPTPPPDFKEVYELLRAHLPGATEAALNQAAVTGLLAQFPGQTALVSASGVAPTNDPPVRATLVEQQVLWLQVSRVTEDLAAQIGAAGQTVPASNHLTGTVLDLRFAAGDAYATVRESASRLAPHKTPLIILINAATSGAAEVLAAELRAVGALLIGNPTAGLALTTEDFPLANGQRLRLATTPVKLNGAALSPLQPDIRVKVNPAEERVLRENPYATALAPGHPTEADPANLTALLDHTTEADLVRQKRRGSEGDDFAPAKANPEPPALTEPVQPVLRDPVLARAIDLVKGLAVVRDKRP